MRDLVPEMAQQRAVGLVHLAAPTLALGIVGRGQSDGDQAEVVAGHHRLDAVLALHVGEEVEGKPLVRILRARVQRQAELQQGVEQVVLRRFELAPAGEVLRHREVGYGAVMAAGGAEAVAALGGDQPVAGIVLGIVAKAIETLVARDRPPAIPLGRQRQQRSLVRLVAQTVATGLALRVLEMKRLAAVLTLEQLHEVVPGKKASRSVATPCGFRTD